MPEVADSFDAQRAFGVGVNVQFVIAVGAELNTVWAPLPVVGMVAGVMSLNPPDGGCPELLFRQNVPLQADGLLTVMVIVEFVNQYASVPSAKPVACAVGVWGVPLASIFPKPMLVWEMVILSGASAISPVTVTVPVVSAYE